MLALISEGARNRRDPGKQFALGQTFLNQTGVDIDRTRERDASDRQIRFMDAIGRKTGEQCPDQRDQAYNESEANHSLTQTSGIGCASSAFRLPPGRRQTN